MPFNESHVVPAAFGNAVQVLPPGIVCQPCNSNFGCKLERALIDDPSFNPYRWYSGLRNARTSRSPHSPIFGQPYPEIASEIEPLQFTVRAGRAGVVIDVQSPVEKQFTAAYTDRQMRLLSRAYHKMAFEGLAWLMFVFDGPMPTFDLFSGQFDSVRRWVKEGQPMTTVRPVLHGPYGEPRADFSMALFHHEGTWLMGFDLFGDQYAASLTSAPESAMVDIIGWAKAQWLNDGVELLWGIGSFPDEGSTAFVIALPSAASS